MSTRLKAAASSAEGYEEERFVAVTLAKFRNAGAALATEAERAELSRLDAKAFALSSTIEQNINEDTSSVTLSDAELAGCPADFIASLPGTPEARECSLKAPVLVPIMRRATSAATRKKMAEASGKKCVAINAPLLDDLIATRHAAAVALGFGSHAERMLALKMAKTAERAKGFARISPRAWRCATRRWAGCSRAKPPRTRRRASASATRSPSSSRGTSPTSRTC